MDIFMIVITLIGAYVLFVLISWLLIRLLFPKIDVDEKEEMVPVKARDNRYVSHRHLKKQKNLAY